MIGPLIWMLAGAGALWAVWRAVSWGTRRAGLVRPNYRGTPIPVAFGLVTVLWAAAALLTAPISLGLAAGVVWPYVAALAGFGLLGLADDIWGDRSARGLRGHVRALIGGRRVTTGLVKAVGGVVLAAALAAELSGGRPWRMAAGALVIALSANAVNLLDLRPGRAGAVFLVLALALGCSLAASGRARAAWPLALVAAPAIAVYCADRRGSVMMGDAGSNALGAVLGVALVSAAPTWGLSLALIALLALHIFAERASITRAIEASPVLRALDRLTGVR